MSPFTNICNSTATEAAAATATTATTAAAFEAEAETAATAMAATSTGTASSSATTKSSAAVAVAAAAGGGGVMRYSNVIAVLTVLLCGLATANGLKCHMCGEYNEGVGSITPCLNYSDQYAHNYLRECPKKSEKFCVKYVSELSTVRDCATECVEKEIWETQTYCCNQDGCNGSTHLEASRLWMLLPLLYVVYTSAFAGNNWRH